MNLPTHVITDSDLSDGHLVGLDAAGAVIVHIQVCPVFKYIKGSSDEDREVVTWRVGKDQARRIAAVAAWQQTGHLCGGSA